MKGLKIAFAVLGAALAGVAIAMIATNPSEAAYEDYATEQLTRYLQSESKNLCQDVPDFLGGALGDECQSLVRSALKDNRAQIRQLIIRGTERQNFGVLSVYKTNLEVISLLPTYEFETVGVFRNFYTYRAEQI